MPNTDFNRYSRSKLMLHYLYYIFLFIALSLSNNYLFAQNNFAYQKKLTKGWENKYKKAVTDLKYGSTKEKIKATILFGGQRNPRFLRPLLDELLKNLEQATIQLNQDNSAYVKSNIAWAIGQIAHPFAVEKLLQALDISVGLTKKQIAYIQKENEKLNKLQESIKDSPYRSTSIPYTYMEADKIAPYLGKNKVPYYNSNQDWSTTDAMKGKTYWINEDTKNNRGKFKTFYINLVRSILIALGKIESPRAIDSIAKYLNPQEYPSDIRVYAAFALGGIGYQKALEHIKKLSKIEKELDVQLSIAYAILRNDKAQPLQYNRLISILQTGNNKQRFQAAKILRDLSIGEALEYLNGAYLIENETMVRAMIKEAIKSVRRNTLLPVYTEHN